ncbi:MAG TPA: ferritin-like domain-containing protein [Nitrososphaera sp.]|nr:ferritin-like domain-containing protein [Nitrososphaera sp.]
MSRTERKVLSKSTAVIADFLNKVYCHGRRIFSYFWYVSSLHLVGIGFVTYANALKTQTNGKLEHTELPANRIQELGDSLQSELVGRAKYSVIGLLDPTKHLTLHLEAKRTPEFEDKAVENYNNLAKKTLELGDHVTYDLATTILSNQVKNKQQYQRQCQIAITKK